MTITQSVSPIKLDRSLSTGPSYSLSSLQISDSSGGLGPSDHPSSSNDSIEVSNHSNLDQLKTTEGAEEGLASATSLPSCPPLPELDLLLEQLLNNCGLVSDASARQRILINMSKDRKWHTVKMLKKMQTGPSSSFLHKVKKDQKPRWLGGCWGFAVLITRCKYKHSPPLLCLV